MKFATLTLLLFAGLLTSPDACANSLKRGELDTALTLALKDQELAQQSWRSKRNVTLSALKQRQLLAQRQKNQQVIASNRRNRP